MPKQESKNAEQCKEIDGEMYCRPGAWLKLKNGDSEFSFSQTKKTKTSTALILLLPGINTAWLAVVSLLSGFATSTWQVALGMAGFTVAMGLLSYLLCIPFVGIYFWANWYNYAATFSSSFGITMNGWLEFVVNFLLVVGAIVQVLLTIIVIVLIVIFARVAK